MNLLLLEEADFVAPQRAVLQGRRLKHLHEVHRAEAGDQLRVGHLGGAMGPWAAAPCWPWTRLVPSCGWSWTSHRRPSYR
jgi:hypothetical protein